MPEIFLDLIFSSEVHTVLGLLIHVRYHCGEWPEEVNACFLNSYMVYL
jgi:hypothetical protein